MEHAKKNNLSNKKETDFLSMQMIFNYCIINKSVTINCAKRIR